MPDNPHYITAAVEDWKEGRISLARLLEIFRSNLFVGYGYLCDEDKAKSVWELIDILNKAQCESVLGELK